MAGQIIRGIGQAVPRLFDEIDNTEGNTIVKHANPDLRNVKPPQEQPQAQTVDLAALIEQLQKSPELASTLAALIAGQKAV